MQTSAQKWATIRWKFVGVVIVAYTVAQNFRFGFETYGGQSYYEGIVFGVGFACVDLGKYVISSMLASPMRPASKLAYVSLVVIMLLGVVASIYAMAMVSLDGLERSAAKGRAAEAQLAERKEERARLKLQIAELGTTVPPAVFEREMEALRQDRRWQSTKGCTDATVSASRTFCAQHARLFSKIAAATKSTRLQAKIDKLTVEIRDATTGDRISRKHVGLAVIARWLGEVADVEVEVEDVALINFLAFAVILEAVGLAIWSRVGALRAPTAPSETSARDDQVIADTLLTTPDWTSGRDQSRSDPPTSVVRDKDTEELTLRPGTRQVRSDIKDHVTAVPSVQSVPSARQDMRAFDRCGSEGKRHSRSRGALTSQTDATPNQSGSFPDTDISTVPDGSTVATFARSCLMHSPGSKSGAQQVRDVYAEWCRQMGVWPVSHQKFAQEMKSLGYKKTRGTQTGGRVYHDVQLLQVTA
jgi:hypothetical protein